MPAIENPTEEQLMEGERLGPLYRLDFTTTCAATVMFQTRLMHRNKIIMDTRGRFLEDLGTLGLPAYLPRRRVVEWMDPRTNAVGEEGVWFAAMYVYEIVKASAKRERDWGHLVFTDLFVNRCLLVMVYPRASGEPGSTHDDYAQLTRWHAHRFMGMCMCIFHDDEPVEWVRATYVTEDELAQRDFRLHPRFLSSFENPPINPEDEPTVFNPFFTVTPQSVMPCLLESDVNKIDSVRAQDPALKDHPVPIPQIVRERVIGNKESRVSFPDSEWQSKHYRSCAHCKKSKKKELNTCSRCNIEYYCGRECQKLAWPEHKRWCRVAF